MHRSCRFEQQHHAFYVNKSSRMYVASDGEMHSMLKPGGNFADCIVPRDRIFQEYLNS